MSLGVLGEYAKSLWVSLRLLHVHIDSFRVFGENSVYRKQPYICRILHIRLNTFRAFSIDA